MSKVLAVIGAQWGSEGKGAIISKIAHQFNVHVRTGGPNAGHTIYHNGQKFVQQVIPCGWTNPNAVLIIGRGMLLDLDRFFEELDIIRKVDPSIDKRVRVDARAGILSANHYSREGGVNGQLHLRIGSTGKGVGAARVDRVARDTESFQLVKHLPDNHPIYNYIEYDTPALIRDLMARNQNVLLEGTQGAGLSLIHGEWPYVTSHDTNAAQLAADAGIPPQYVETLLVARTMPIRVAGNSGPLPNETNWNEVSKNCGKLVHETTTVTNKTRRVAYWSDEVIDQAILLNNPIGIALTFLDYIPEEHRPAIIGEIERRHKVPVLFTGLGGRPEDIEVRDAVGPCSPAWTGTAYDLVRETRDYVVQ